MTLREQVRDMFVGFDCDSWYCAGVIIELFEKMIDEKLDKMRARHVYTDTFQTIEVLKELKEELKK
jgi:hypothetical protein